MRLFQSVLVVFGLIGAGATVAAGSASASTKAPYVVGATEDLSGPLSAYGHWVDTSWNAEFNAVNKAGGINGHKIHLTVLDDQSNLTTAEANYKEFIGDHAILTTASTLSTICAALAPKAATNKVPLSCGTATTTLLKPVEPYVFTRQTPGETYAQPVITVIPTIAKTKSPKVGVYIVAAADALQMATKVTQLAKAKGWTITDEEQASPTATSLNPSQIAKLAASKPNVVVTYVATAFTQALVKGLRGDGYGGPILSPVPDFSSMTALKTPSFYEMTTTEYITPSSTKSGAAQYVKVMKASGISSAAALNTGIQAVDYLGALVAVTALKKCGSTCTAQQLSTQMGKTTLHEPGIATTWGYSSSSHNGAHTTYMYQYLDGKVKLVKGNIPLGSL